MKRTQGDIPFERGPVFRGQVYERVGISLVEVYEKVANLSLRCERPERANIHFMATKKSRKHSGFVIYSCFKDSTFLM